MLKKLFISLLILTALGYEGITGLPGAIYSFCMQPENFLGSFSEQGVAPEQAGEADSGYALDCYAQNGLFVLTQNSILKLKSSAFDNDTTKNNFNPSQLPAVSMPVSDITSGEKEFTFLKSGLSPPSCKA